MKKKFWVAQVTNDVPGCQSYTNSTPLSILIFILSFEYIKQYHLPLVMNSTKGVSRTTPCTSKPSPSTAKPKDTKDDSTQCPFSHRVGK